MFVKFSKTVSTLEAKSFSLYAPPSDIKLITASYNNGIDIGHTKLLEMHIQKGYPSHLTYKLYSLTIHFYWGILKGQELFPKVFEIGQVLY